MIAIRFHRLAAKELRAAYGWYAARNLDAANRFLIAVDRAVLRVRQDPDSFPTEHRAHPVDSRRPIFVPLDL
jgi:plasmid stabilization system protein ParE